MPMKYIEKVKVLYDAFIFGVFTTTVFVLLADHVGMNEGAVAGLYLASLIFADVYMTTRELIRSFEKED